MPVNKNIETVNSRKNIYLTISLYYFWLSWHMNQTANWIVPFLSELVIDMFLCLVSTWISNVICNIYVSKKHVALKTNILASSYDIMCFCRTWILWRPFPYWLWEWDKGYIYIISWLEQGCCFCEQLQHWKILAGKILCILFCYLFMNSSYIYFLIINLCFAYFTLNCFFFQARGPQCALYVPGPTLRPGDNVIVCT